MVVDGAVQLSQSRTTTKQKNRRSVEFVRIGASGASSTANCERRSHCIHCVLSAEKQTVNKQQHISAYSTYSALAIHDSLVPDRLMTTEHIAMDSSCFNTKEA